MSPWQAVVGVVGDAVGGLVVPGADPCDAGCCDRRGSRTDERSMMNESITCEEVLHLARHLHACMDEVVKSLQLLAAGADGAVLPAGSAGAFRTLADYIERPPSMAATKAGITLRRAADQIAPTAEPDLTTVEGWNEVARRWLADGPPPGWRGHTDRLEVANPVARWLSLDPELVRLAARVGGAL